VSIRVRLPPILARVCGTDTCEVIGDTVGKCLESLKTQFPAIKDYLLDRQGRLLGIYGIYLNAEGIYPADPDTPVHGNDEIIILNFIIGG
jgi:molybdopterin converting factor small subunit